MFQLAKVCCILILTFLISGCSDKSQSELLMQTEWKYVNKITTNQTDAITRSTIADCELDDQLIFMENGIVQLTRGTTLCDQTQAANEAGNWTLLDDEILVLEVEGFSDHFSILELSRKKLRLYQQESFPGGWIDTEYVFER